MNDDDYEYLAHNKKEDKIDNSDNKNNSHKEEIN